jgi:hypothetical protein
MKFAGYQFSTFLVDAHNLAASLSESATISKESITQQTNPFKAASEEHTPVGLDRAMLSVGGGFYDETTDAIHTALGTIVGVRRIVSAAAFGNDIGKPFIGFEGAYSQKFEVQDVKDGLTRANASYIVDGTLEEGVILQHLQAFTADWNTKTGGANATDAPVYFPNQVQRAIPITSNSIANPSVVTTPIAHGLTTGDVILISGVASSSPTINGERTVTVISPTTFSVPVNVTVGGTGGSFLRASSENGGVGYLHVTAFSGITNVVVKIQHSVDDITYADLVTFATVTAVGRERLAVAGAVDGYLAVDGNITGAGSVTVFVGFCRK